METKIYTDGACIGNPGPGGWAAIIIEENEKKELFGGEKLTTNNRMELTAAIKALEFCTKQDEKQFCRLFIGHAGWSSGQLEREIEKGDWLVQETSPDFIFKIPIDQMWDVAIQSFGIDIAGLSTLGGQA